MIRQCLFNQRSSGTRETKDEDRLRAVHYYGHPGEQAHAPTDEELPQAFRRLLRLSIIIVDPGSFTLVTLRLVETGESFIIALEAIEDPTFLEKRIGIQGFRRRRSITILPGVRRLQLSERRDIIALSRAQDGPLQPQRRIVRANPRRLLQAPSRCGEITLRLLQSRPTEPSLKDVRPDFDRFVVEPPRFANLPLTFEIPRQIGLQDRIGHTGQLNGTAIMILSGPWAAVLGQHHGHQLM